MSTDNKRLTLVQIQSLVTVMNHKLDAIVIASNELRNIDKVSNITMFNHKLNIITVSVNEINCLKNDILSELSKTIDEKENTIKELKSLIETKEKTS